MNGARLSCSSIVQGGGKRRGAVTSDTMIRRSISFRIALRFYQHLP
jgi:hypothetical protein